MRSMTIVWLPLLLALAAPAVAQEHAHHPVIATAAPATQAQRWKTDASLREGMGRIHEAVDALQHYEHGHMGPDQAVELAAGIERDVGFIVAHCELEPKADAALHPILGAFVQGAQALKAKPTDLSSIPPLRSALQDYARQFDDPGVPSIKPEQAR
jgi:hypothetical protein